MKLLSYRAQSEHFDVALDFIVIDRSVSHEVSLV
jgi:hypothetical protein